MFNNHYASISVRKYSGSGVLQRLQMWDGTDCNIEQRSTNNYA